MAKCSASANGLKAVSRVAGSKCELLRESASVCIIAVFILLCEDFCQHLFRLNTTLPQFLKCVINDQCVMAETGGHNIHEDGRVRIQGAGMAQ